MSVEIDPIAEKYYSKLTSPSKRSATGGGQVDPTRYELNPIHKALMRRRMESEKIFDTLPDMETIISVAVSSILCTKDLVTTSLIYDSEPFGDDFPSDIREGMVQVIRDFFNKEKKLPQKLYEWLYQAMSVSGATPVMIVSESALDEMFNISRESFSSEQKTKTKSILKSTKGLWGDLDGKPQFMTEGYSKPSNAAKDLSFNIFKDNDELGSIYGTETTIRLIDNTTIAKLPTIRKKQISMESFSEQAAKRFEESYNKVQVDNNKDKTSMEIAKALNPNYDSSVSIKQFASVPLSVESGRSNTHGLEIVLPAEAVIPLTMPGSETEPVAYLVSFDNSGNPLSLRNVGNIDNMFVNSANGSENVVSSTARALGMGDSDLGSTFPKLVEQCSELIERQFLKSLENGALGEGVTIGKNEDFYRVMTARQMSKRDTNILCIPADQLAYFAVDIDSNGIGRSIIDRSKVISTARMVHLFASMRCMIENSSRQVLHTITLPEEERDGERAVAMAMHDITRKNHSFAPTWGDVDDVYSTVNNSGLLFKVVGNEHYPSSDIERTDVTPDFKMPEKELDDLYIRRICAVARVDPDLILQPENIEFASQIWSKSLISAKQVIMKQIGINKSLSSYVKSYTYASGPLLDALVDVIKSNMTVDEESLHLVPKYIRQFIDGINITLPLPDTTFTKSQMEQYSEKMTIIKEIISDCVTDKVAEAMGVGDAESLRGLIASWYGINWMRDNGVETELIDLFCVESDHRAMVKDISDRHSIVGGLIARIDKHVASKLETAKKNFASDEVLAAGDSGGGMGGFGEDTGMSEGEFGDDTSSDEFGGDGADIDGDSFGDDMGDTTSDDTIDEFDTDNESTDDEVEEEDYETREDSLGESDGVEETTEEEDDVVEEEEDDTITLEDEDMK